MKLFITPNPEQSGLTNGIGQVIAAQYRHLPGFGFELVGSPDEADLVIAHIQGVNLPRVDCLHVHGLHWSGDKANPQTLAEDNAVNRAVLDSVKRARAVTVPSQWVAQPFLRDMHFSPTVIGHGIELADWKPLPLGERSNYILYNKNREDSVCQSKDAVELAKRGLPVVSTYGDKAVMQVTGLVPFEQMKDMIRGAGCYLATTKETFGIGTLEALAAGVPVLGYDWGGTSDLITHKVNGYLVKPGDINGLAEGYAYIQSNLKELSIGARSSALGYDWPHVIEKYAQLYRETYELKKEASSVSVVITNYNYAAYVGTAIESALNQTAPCDVIVVDDGSTDNSRDIIKEGYDNPKRSLITSSYQENQGVAAARNNGIALAYSTYIVCLDADDWLSPDYIEVLAAELDAHPELGIVYTGLMLHFADGTAGASSWPGVFDFDEMATHNLPPSNTIPCAAMFRREMWERVGGYKQHFAPGEDTEFWLRGLAAGYGAKRVTTKPLFNYRLHADSASRTKTYTYIDGDKPWTIDKQFPMAAPARQQGLVRSYSEPLISVIIPVGPGHAKFLPTALDSLVGQTFRNWEAIVIDDTEIDDELMNAGLLTRYPFIKAIFTGGKEGAGAARNLGLAAAKAPLSLFLDADDWLDPTALEKMAKLYARSDGRYIYTDWYSVEEDGAQEVQPCMAYDPDYLIAKKGIHAITVLISTDAAREIGFDTEMVGWEDNDFFMHCATKGYHGARLPEPLLYYRVATGTRRNDAFKQSEKLFGLMEDRYSKYLEGSEKIMACCGQSARQPILQLKSQIDLETALSRPTPPGMARMVYVGENMAGITYNVGGKAYVGANNDNQRYIEVIPEHVDRLLMTGFWQQA